MNALTREQLIMLAAGMMIGGGSGYLLANAVLKKKYEALVNEEVQNFKDSYQRLHKLGEYSDPTNLVTASGEPLEKGFQKQRREDRNVYADTLKGLEYTSESEVEVDGDTVTETDTEEVELQTEDGTVRVVEENVIRHNVFETVQPDPVELEDRDTTKPYVISIAEFMENGTRDSITITYYAGDDTLADDNEKVIDNIDNIIGVDNLERFGHGSQDDSVVYIRNERLGADFEVVRDEGSYSVTVLGQHHGERND